MASNKVAREKPSHDCLRAWSYTPSSVLAVECPCGTHVRGIILPPVMAAKDMERPANTKTQEEPFIFCHVHIKHSLKVCLDQYSKNRLEEGNEPPSNMSGRHGGFGLHVKVHSGGIFSGR